MYHDLSSYEIIVKFVTNIGSPSLITFRRVWGVNERTYPLWVNSPVDKFGRRTCDRLPSLRAPWTFPLPTLWDPIPRFRVNTGYRFLVVWFPYLPYVIPLSTTVRTDNSTKDSVDVWERTKTNKQCLFLFRECDPSVSYTTHREYR